MIAPGKPPAHPPAALVAHRKIEAVIEEIRLMRFAILGTHPDGLEMARALVETGRHQLIAYTSSQPLDSAYLDRWGSAVRRLHDLEELLADPQVEAVIVAGAAENRSVQLRRALQAERHVLCVYPPDQSPDVGYEAAMLQNDTRCVLMPLMPTAFHPGIRRLAEMIRSGGRPLVELKLIEIEFGSPEAVLLDASIPGRKPSFPGWDVLRMLGGELAEVMAITSREELEPEAPVVLSGRFERGCLFQASLLPYQQQPHWRATAVGSHGRAELYFPQGWKGPAFLSWLDRSGELHEETWELWDPWPTLVETFESTVASSRSLEGESKRTPGVSSSPTPLTWQDAIRALELDDAARRSIRYRRVSALEYPEATEEVGFKGTMTLMGCGLLWALLAIAILAAWFPRLGWLVLPLLVLFLTMQLLRWFVPGKRNPAEGGRPGGD